MSNQSANVRSAFIPRPGYFFLDQDWSQIEFRLSAYLAGEVSLIEGFEQGHDYYKMIFRQMAAGSGRAVDIEAITQKERKIGKEVALGQSYGQEFWGLARKLGISNEAAREIMDAYWAGLPRTAAAKEKALHEAYKYGGVWTLFGRWRPLPTLRSTDKKEKAKAIRSVWNTIIQGTCADLLKIAIIRTCRAFKGWDVHLTLNQHDEELLMVSFQEPFRVVANTFRGCMEFKVPVINRIIPVGQSAGMNFGEVREDNPDGLMEIEPFVQKFGHLLNLTDQRPHNDNVITPVAAPQPAEIIILPVKKEPPALSGLVEHVMGQQPNDYDYPCVMVLGLTSLSEKQANFLKALVQQFSKDGTHRLYFSYEGKLMRLPEELRVRPTDEFQNYLRRALGETLKIDLYDETGRPTLKQLNFA
jgi:hypothetical protein